ncbi:hypothetical protein [Malacoplasma iowae]|uniref:Uncharacterized protein n=1 Tax=Malacoplasma iowae 695 TaxID=1048830 RepID=A0A6P1LE12_MALIO|nr:hypothetical protein [Malacoplasma iowae]VEU63393.1 Uncharacterised protein [Mycoplasmopsis fermentans]EGZ31548.1 hypothetical protein GUU_01472 [Malacoplasma iowae 695]QHG89658.1 hypothetical protein EER00_01960 [Malacoplasma iowae 695]WPL35555.1 hypothetical protein QX180_04485 [Malacoplasma iowae]VEU72114.1 Uncharacterised protein [Malacoplasma iowae]
MRYKKTFLLLFSFVPLIAISTSLLSCSNHSTTNNNQQIPSKPENGSNNDIENNNPINFKNYSEQEKIFFGEKNIPNQDEINYFKKDLMEFKNELNQMSKQEVYQNYEKTISLINTVWNQRVKLIKSLSTKVLNDELTFEEALNEFNKNILDQRFSTSNWNQIMNITKERTIAEARYTESLNEKGIGDVVSKLENVWIKTKDIPQQNYQKISQFFNTFGFLDIIYKYKKEIAIFPYLYEKNFNISYGKHLESLASMKNNNIYDDDKIVILYRTYKEISLIVDCLNWYGISPLTTNSYWYNWVILTKPIFDDSYDKSQIKLKGDFVVNKIGDWDKKADKRFDESKINNYLPEEVKQKGQFAIDQYIKELIYKIEGTSENNLSNEQKNEMLKNIFNKICYAVEFNAYKSNFFIENYIFSEESKFINVFNNSLFNNDMKINKSIEILNAYKDDEKINGLVFLGDKLKNKFSMLTEEELIYKLDLIEKEYWLKAKDSNMFKIYLANKYIRQFDLFKEIYFEMSIFPHLFESVVGYKYEDWSHKPGASDPLYGYLYKDYLLEQYLLYRDWKIYYEENKDKAKSEIIKNFESTTLESNWYKWFLTIDFKNHYQSLTGWIPNQPPKEFNE